MPDASFQYLRKCNLIVAGRDLEGLDLSEFRIKFSVKRSESQTPNAADIRVYNVSQETAIRIRKEFTTVLLQAGYNDNYGVIFQGNIKQVIIGRESATDTFIDIIAGDGDQAYNYAIVKTSIAAGSNLKTQVDAAIGAMASRGVTQGFIGELSQVNLPRGKVMYGNARNYLRDITQTAEASWSIQNGKVNIVDKKSYLPGTQVVLTSTTGMIGTPQQTNDGVNVKCLLNPLINISGRIYIEESSILQQKLNLDQIALAGGNVKRVNELSIKRLNAEGSYYVLVLEHQGDTRGQEWYTNLICLNIDISANPRNSVTGANG